VTDIWGGVVGGVKEKAGEHYSKFDIDEERIEAVSWTNYLKFQHKMVFELLSVNIYSL